MDDEKKNSLYDQISTHEDVRGIVRNRMREGAHIEFKSIPKGDCKAKGVQKKIQELLSKAASGFAHQAGGTVVWGVVAREVKGVDCAQALEPIQDLGEFLTTLEQLSRDAAEPPLFIEHKPIYCDDDATGDIGFIKSFFPSSRELHIARHAHYDFYERVGGDFHPIISKAHMAAVLGRHQAPYLELYSKVTGASSKKLPGGGKLTTKFNARLYLKNSGSGIAEFPNILFGAKSIRRIKGPDGSQLFPFGNFITTEGGEYNYQFLPRAGVILFPGQELELANLYIETGRIQPIKYKCYAKGMAPIESETLPEDSEGHIHH